MGGGGYSWEFLVGVCRPVLQILTLFQTKKCHFPHLFSDLKKFIPIFRPGGGNKTQHYMFTIKQKLCHHPFLICILHFLSYSVGIETTNTLIRNRSSFINHTRFHTEMSKVYTRFQTKTAQRPYPLGRHIPIWLISGSKRE